MINYYGEAQQDKFVTKMLNEKRDGYFVEIGSNHPINCNNSYLLESKLNWRGIMVEYSNQWINLYQEHRKNSIHLIADGTTINYRDVLETNNFPTEIDYLQIDLEATNGSSIKALEIFNKDVFDKYKFATITFEHDIWVTDKYRMRERSREILEERGYYRVIDDVHNKEPKYVYEDWYIHPDLVNLDYAKSVREKNIKNYEENGKTNKSICWSNIEY